MISIIDSRIIFICSEKFIETSIRKLVYHLVIQLPYPLQPYSIFLFSKSNAGKLQALPGVFPSLVVQGKVKLNIFECEKK